MRFSVWPNPTQSFPEMQEIARHAESTGWDGLWLADHFMPDAEDTSAPWPEAWTTLAGLAATVPRIRLGTLVTGNTYRHPAVLAKMAATVDHISGGRVVLGLGSGWQENEHRQYGIEFGGIGERLAKLEEACQVIKALFSEKSADFDGRHYRLDAASLEPKPLQSPLPLLVGGGGEKVTLRITARHADEWNVWGEVDTLVHKMAVLDRHCADVGRDPKAIQRSAVALLFLSDDADFVAGMRDRDIGRPKIVGNADEVRDVVQAYRDAGVDELIVPDFTLGPMREKKETLDRFIEEVAAPLR
ncbi:MAG: LLM class F420-dependent oxidoreductase [Myxococcota bacterium]